MSVVITDFIKYLFSLSLPEIIFGVFIIMVVSSEIGYFIGYNLVKTISKAKGTPFKSDIDDNVNTITNSSLALLGLFLGFAFSSAMDHFEKNRDFVITEASAISTVYRFTNIVEEPYKANLRKDLISYVDVRLKLAVGDVNDKGIRDIGKESEKQMSAIWNDSKELISKNPNWAFGESFLQAVNSMALMQTERTENLLNEVPHGLFAPVALFLLFNGILMGMSLGETAKRHLLLSWGMYLLVALAVGIIVDLDRPLQGFINVNQDAMVALRERMN